MISVEKPGTPEELLHVGTKGMKWGVRKNRVVDTGISRGLGITTTGSRERAAARTSKTPMSTKKKVAIGVGVAGVAAGAAFVGYKLKSTHDSKLSLVKFSSEINKGRALLKNTPEEFWKQKASKAVIFK